MAILYGHRLTCTADAGISIHAAIREAIVLALSENRNVDLIFNDTMVSIEPPDVIGPFVITYNKKRGDA